MARRRRPNYAERQLAVTRSEAAYVIALIRERLARFIARLGSGRGAAVASRYSIDDRIATLRRLLRRTPWWVNGHLRLGFTELTRELASQTGRDRRALQTIRICGEAVLRLTDQASVADVRPSGPAAQAAPSERYPAERCEAELLFAMELFLRKEFERALERLLVLVGPERSVHLTRRSHLLAIEHAGAAALALGERERAKELFHSIPEGARTRETSAAINYLKGDG